MLSNPPPLAEQFIHDLRRMISIARERIRIRKHVPKLSAIHELEDEKEETGESSKQSRKDSSLTPVPEMYGYGKVSKEPKKRVKEIQEKAEGSTPLNSVSQQEIPAAEPVSKLDTSSDNCDKSSATHDSKEGEGNENSSLVGLAKCIRVYFYHTFSETEAS
jgi:hypothetical protein